MPKIQGYWVTISWLCFKTYGIFVPLKLSCVYFAYYHCPCCLLASALQSSVLDLNYRMTYPHIEMTLASADMLLKLKGCNIFLCPRRLYCWDTLLFVARLCVCVVNHCIISWEKLSNWQGLIFDVAISTLPIHSGTSPL
jgi:hypothetical protein